MQLYICTGIIALNSSIPPPQKKATKPRGKNTPLWVFLQSIFNKYLYSILMKAFDTGLYKRPWPPYRFMTLTFSLDYPVYSVEFKKLT